jgi:hypothetical protein
MSTVTRIMLGASLIMLLAVVLRAISKPASTAAARFTPSPAELDTLPLQLEPTTVRTLFEQGSSVKAPLSWLALFQDPHCDACRMMSHAVTEIITQDANIRVALVGVSVEMPDSVSLWARMAECASRQGDRKVLVELLTTPDVDTARAPDAQEASRVILNRAENACLRDEHLSESILTKRALLSQYWLPGVPAIITAREVFFGAVPAAALRRSAGAVEGHQQ